MNKKMLADIENYVTGLFENNVKFNLYFHNFEHTKQVVSYAESIGENSGCSSEEVELLKIAAWFHDTGFTETYEGHEEVSAKIAEEYLKGTSVSKNQIEKIKMLILATQIKFTPVTLCEKVICDADLAHLGTHICPNRQKALRNELEEVLEFSYTDREWLKINISFMRNHKFSTEYAQAKFGTKKEKNLAALEKKFYSDQ